jgi:hypothetical protein
LHAAALRLVVRANAKPHSTREPYTRRCPTPVRVSPRLKAWVVLRRFGLAQVLFKDDTFQWARLENLITLASDVPSGANSSLDLSETMVDGAKVFFTDEYIRNALILALTQDDRLHVEEVRAGPLCVHGALPLARSSHASGA